MPEGTNAGSALKRELPLDVKDRLIVALDRKTVVEAEAIVARLEGVVSFYKIGLGLQFAEGVDGLMSSLTQSGKKLFLDAKMYDVPATVGQAVATAARRGATFVTVHGDGEIIKAAVAAKAGSGLKVFAVTVLTSLDDAALRDMGYGVTARELVALRARMAVSCRCDGIIASADDDPDQIRRLAGSAALLIATPGIRPAGSAVQDQKRIATPREAIAHGADYLVVGRPIIDDEDPRRAALEIIEEMRRGDEERVALAVNNYD